ncbi:MAG TPA: tetraacyldisaccharide 4'-kinase [Gemmatimonadaceae bacterium]|jgi:tetraacyldisaccharide 4'-kinase|nr:tetraacyldisaccharide 4'-kinase [Gemmatimonadaceae bacterium]
MTSLERIWYDDALAARLARAALAPPAALYEAIVRARGALYDRGTLGVRRASLPVLSVGNLSVGGTGKTPIAAWAATRLRALGAHPSIVLRGYGGDETLVHARLNPDVPVIADADRVRGVERARVQGADCVVLDDGFQHRRLARTADWVLVAAEQFARSRRLLPAGPLREPVSALRRAQLLIVTRKSATFDIAESVADQLAAGAHGVATAVCRLALSAVVNTLDGEEHPLARVRGARIVAVAAIGAPAAYFAQLRALGVSALREIAFPDHHAFDRRDVDHVVHESGGYDAVVCTLKDAVKLAPLWPHVALPLWYVSQQAEIERGGTALDASLAEILSARAGISSTAGAAG